MQCAGCKAGLFRYWQEVVNNALARAHRWNDLIETGHVTSIAELADHNQVDPAYISRFLRLTTLAPDIQVMARGETESGLNRSYEN